MGAYKSPPPPCISPTPKTKNPLPLWICGAFALIVCALTWKDVIEYVNGEPQIKAKYLYERQKKLDETDICEQYALIALREGWYTCLHSGVGLYYLKVGEVWKYGVTTKGERGRYTVKFLRSNMVNYFIQFSGTMNECLKEEQRKLYDYPLLPENLARQEEHRLIRPPYNPILR